MMTVDQCFTQFYPKIQNLSSSVDRRDARILNSLYKQLLQRTFLTENQAKLLAKILKENISTLVEYESNLNEVLDLNLWSEKFRVVEKSRKIYRSPSDPLTMVVEFSFDKRLRETFNLLNNSLEGHVVISNKEHRVMLTEHNIFTILNALSKEKFEVEQEILDFYDEIKKIKDQNSQLYNVFSLENKNLIAAIEDDIGKISQENLLLLEDRKIRYQYFVPEKSSGDTLANKIARREKTKIYLSSDVHTLTDVFKSLQLLNRFPMLVIFEGHNPVENKKYLDFLTTAIQETEISGDIGIYFRFDSKLDTVSFNKTISDMQFNKNLTPETMIAGLANSKLPKFAVSAGWKPKSIVTFTNGFKNNKVSVCFNDIDLVIFYNDKKPLHGAIDAIV